MKKLFVTLFMLLSLFVGTTSTVQGATYENQEGKVTGIIKDASGNPVVAANVLIKGTQVIAFSNNDGTFILSGINPDAVLVISCLGYVSQEISLYGKSHVEITLKDDSQVLDELVVVGYGTQKKATITGSVSQVGGDELKKVAAINLSNTLAGKMAGVIANVRSGEPGEDGASITIRGKGTLGNTSPLIVVDGIADRGFSRLNPEDIESISVLKDASAAIYGARAANGVILITTKRGKEGIVKMNYSGNVGLTQPTRVPQVLDALEYATYVNEYDRGHNTIETYDADVLQKLQDGSDPINYPNTNWWDSVAKQWSTKTQHSFSVSGGSDKVSFYTSAQYLWQDAIFKESVQNYSQYQFVSNIDAKLTKGIQFSLDILGRQEVRNRGVYETDYMLGKFLSTNPMAAAYYPNGLPRIGYDGVTNNAAIMITDKPGYSKEKYNVINLKPRLKLDLDFITEGLYAEGYTAVDFSFTNGKSLNRPYDLYLYNNETGEYDNLRAQTGAISVGAWSSNSTSVTLNARLGYSRIFSNAHKIDAFVSYEQNQYNYSYLGADRTNYLSDAIPEIFAGSSDPKDLGNDGYASASARRHVFGRLNYSYNDKYLAEVTLRYDGSMNFAPGKRWGLFPGISAGWVISEEPFYENLKSVMNFLKFKLSWGMMGNDNIDAYQYLDQYAFGSAATFGTENTINKVLYSVRTANPIVTWESAQIANIGFSALFLNNKFGLDLDYFYSKRRDILITRNASVPSYTGLTLPAENLGKVDNQGIEIVANYQDKSGDFSWGINGNFTFAKNKVVYMDEAASVPEWQKREGNAIDCILMYEALGIYQTQQEIDNSVHIDGAKPGDLIYLDQNNDGAITTDDMHYIYQSATPQIVYGFTLNGAWKGLDLNVFFQGQARAKKIYMPYMNMITDFYEGRWIDTNSSEENANARWPRACIKQTYIDDFNGRTSTWWLRDASFLRLKSVEIGYVLPESVTRKAGIDYARIYINGNNLFSIDKIKICDPEVSNAFDSYPIQRIISMGVNITF